jgi:hypothetical protein
MAAAVLGEPGTAEASDATGHITTAARTAEVNMVRRRYMIALLHVGEC